MVLVGQFDGEYLIDEDACERFFGRKVGFNLQSISRALMERDGVWQVEEFHRNGCPEYLVTSAYVIDEDDISKRENLVTTAKYHRPLVKVVIVEYCTSCHHGVDVNELHELYPGFQKKDYATFRCPECGGHFKVPREHLDYYDAPTPCPG